MIEFKKYDQREWELMVVRSLPADFNLEKLIHRIESGINYEAFKHKSSLYKYRPVHNNDTGWKITCIAEGSDQEVNNLLLKSLEYGAESIIIKINEDDKLNILLRDIRTDYIECIFDMRHCTAAKILTLTEYIARQDTINNAQSKVIIYTTDRESIHTVHSTYRLCTPYWGAGDSLSDELVGICNFICSELKKDPKATTIPIHLSTKDYFFTEIAKLRALRVLAANIAEMLELSKPEIKIIAQVHSELSDESLIRQSFLVLAAILGGADHIVGLPWSVAGMEQARLSQNIQNVYKQESGLDFYKDPTNGSFFVEDLTKQIITKTWNDWIGQF